MTSRFPKSLPMAPKIAQASQPGALRSNFTPDFSIVPSTDFFPKQVRVKLRAADSFYVYIQQSPKNDVSKSSSDEPVKKNPKAAIPGLYADPNSILVVLFLHGAGFSGLSWAPLVQSLNLSVLNTHYVSLDLRGHGKTQTENEDDFSFEVLSRDVCDVYSLLVEKKLVPANEEGNVRLFVVGHSMGGALAAYIGAHCRDQLNNIAATCVIDVVEGSAMDALSGMKNVLRSRPSSFSSAENAIEWSVRSGYIKRRDSAKVTMIGQIVPQKETQSSQSGTCNVASGALESLQEVENDDDEQQQYVEDATANVDEQPPQNVNKNMVSKQECDQEIDKGPFPRCEIVTNVNIDLDILNNVPYTWRLDLFKTEKFWRSWFTGLTNNYLAFTGPKLLILAGVDRLDKELTVAQMQGKFQMLVLPKAGHAVHEDVPDRVADALATFIQRNKLAPTVESGFSRTNAGC